MAKKSIWVIEEAVCSAIVAECTFLEIAKSCRKHSIHKFIDKIFLNYGNK
jgi:hypothetical protein